MAREFAVASLHFLVEWLYLEHILSAVNCLPIRLSFSINDIKLLLYTA